MVPGVLQQVQKIKDPWPNVDAISVPVPSLRFDRNPYYTALFGVARALGICAQYIIARGVGRPITAEIHHFDWLIQYIEKETGDQIERRCWTDTQPGFIEDHENPFRLERVRFLRSRLKPRAPKKETLTPSSSTRFSVTPIVFSASR